jgi:hypothetical protein
MDRRPAPAKRVELDIAFVRGGANNTFKQRDRFLSRVAEPFLRLRINRGNIVPKILNSDPWTLIEIHFEAKLPGSRPKAWCKSAVISLSPAGLAGMVKWPRRAA